jgi:hypothetical protein
MARINCNTCKSYIPQKIYEDDELIETGKCSRFNYIFEEHAEIGWNPENRVCDYWEEHYYRISKNTGFRDVKEKLND